MYYGTTFESWLYFGRGFARTANPGEDLVDWWRCAIFLKRPHQKAKPKKKKQQQTKQAIAKKKTVVPTQIPKNVETAAEPPASAMGVDSDGDLE